MRLVIAVLLATMIVGPALAAKKPKNELAWTYPGFDSLDVQSIAMLPVASYDNNHQSEKTVEDGLGMALRTAGYRWVSGSSSRDRLRYAGGDSLLRLVKQGITTAVRTDSLAAPKLCATLGVNALLTVRVDLWEKVEIEWDQAGKPSTTVQVKAALVDSSGRLLWTASGSETGEGQYHDPSAGTIGVKSSDIGGRTPITGQTGAPSFEEVVMKLFATWPAKFPARHVTAVPAK